MSNPIITRLDEAANSAGMTRAELTRAAKLGANTLSQLERKPEGKLQARTALKLAEVLEVSPEWLVTGEGPQQPAAKKVKAVKKTLKKAKRLVVAPTIPEFAAFAVAPAAPQVTGFLPQLIASKVAQLPDDGQRIVLGFVIETLERINASR